MEKEEYNGYVLEEIIGKGTYGCVYRGYILLIKKG
jgi:hypothetical protein